MHIKNIITTLSIIISFSCISIPEVPKNETPECLAHFFETRTKMKNYRHGQWGISGGIAYLSLSLAWAAGVDGLFPLITIPYFLYIQKQDANKIYENYLEKHCNK
ncbi:hypothetical protein [Leptospira yanagawae]|uniref:hypothetical protein n=1 Tax=Leptospira yanagawae TaxID=293069 RepID=UPI000586FB70|nr:hypothetical protein [Leptospira yanagawae]